MSLAERVSTRAATRSIRRAADPVTMEEFGYLLGQGRGGGMTKAGVTMSPSKAMGISAWHRGVRYLTETVSSLPVATFRVTPTSKERRANPPWMSRPDTELPWYGLIEQVMMAELHRGNSYNWRIRNDIGQVTGLRPIHPDRVRTGQAPDGTKVFQIDNRTDVGFTTREIFHIPGLSSNGVFGLDPLTLMSEGLGRAAAADQFASSSFGQGSHLQAYLSIPQPLTEEEAAATKAQWEKFHKGMANANEFGVIGNGAEYKTVSLTPEQQQLLETRKFEVTEIARFLGVVPHKLYDLEHATFSNIEHQSIEAVVDGIRPWVERIEAWVNFDPYLLPPGSVIEFDLDGLLRGDSAARAAYYTAGINGGWLMPSAPARLEGQPAPPELDYYLRPLNMAVIRPGDDDVEDDDEEPDENAATVAETVQKVYLGVPAVLSREEARQIINDAGGKLATGGGS